VSIITPNGKEIILTEKKIDIVIWERELKHLNNGLLNQIIAELINWI
jgi:hypothetical protein